MSYALRFVDMLEGAGLTLSDVRLIRHQTIGSGGETPYSVWVRRSEDLALYQSCQRGDRRSHFTAPFWASFVGTPNGGTLFVGLFEVISVAPVTDEYIAAYGNLPIGGKPSSADDAYQTVLSPHLAGYIGRLSIDWGPGTRSWVQLASSPAGQTKPVVELKRVFQEPEFPGFDRFLTRLSTVTNLPLSWQSVLRASGGIYLLTCPRTKEQYVGKASGGDGFLGRWLEYALTGHGGNVVLRARDPSDYQVSILEVFGSGLDEGEIARRESLWKDKLQTRAMGLNGN